MNNNQAQANIGSNMEYQRMVLHDRIKEGLGFHPGTPEVTELFEKVRSGYIALAHEVIDLTPPGREQSVALTQLEDSLMWAIKAIAVHMTPLGKQSEWTRKEDA